LALVGSEAKAKQLRELLDQRGQLHGPLAGGLDVEIAVRVKGEPAARAQLAAYLEAQKADGFDVFLDSAGGDYLQPGLAALAPCGRHVIFGAGTLTPPPGVSVALGLGLLRPRNLLAALRLAYGMVTRPRVDVLSLPGSNTGSLGFNLIYLYGRQDLMTRLYANVDELRLPAPHVGVTEPWARLPEALAALQGGGTLGKVVVVVGEGDE
jgi:alcohol dehydrogenase